MSLTKAEFAAKVADKSNLTKKDAGIAVDAFLDTVKEILTEGDSVSFVGFGSFLVRDRGPRKGRNPQKNVEVDIPAKKVPAFKPSQAMKDLVNK